MKDQRNKALFTAFANDRNTLQMLLVDFIEEGNWVRLKRTLTIPPFNDAARSLHEHPSMFGANILHIALANQSPIGIINSLLLHFPETPFLPDNGGRYPLHIASSVGISSEIGAAIARAYSPACMKKYQDGKALLRFARAGSRAVSNHIDRGRLNSITIFFC